MIKHLNEVVDPSWAKRIKKHNPNAYAILYGWQYKNEPEVEIAPEVYMDKSSLDRRLNQIVKDYSVYSLISPRGNRYAKESDILFYILYPSSLGESKTNNITSNKIGYHNHEYYGANETGLDSIIRYEMGELGNSDIIDTVLNTFEVSIEEQYTLEAALDVLEDEGYLGDTALDLVVKTLLNIIWKKYPNAKYGLWLCETPDAVKRWYDGNKDNILTYRIENEQPISDLGFNDQGCLFVYDKPTGNYNIKTETLREDLVVDRVAILGSSDKKLEDVCKKFKNKIRVVRDACEDINGFLAMYLCEEGYTDVYAIRGMFKVDTFDWVALKDFSSKELYLIRKTYGNSSKQSLLKYVESLPTDVQKEFYYIPHTWCELPGGIIIDAAWKMFEPYIKGELSKSHYYHFDLIEDITTYSGYTVKTMSGRKMYGKEYLDSYRKLTESQNKQDDSKVYKLDDITKRQVQRNPLYSNYRIEVVELEPLVTLLMKNTSILGRRTDNWGDSFDKFHIKSNKAYWYNDPIRLVKMSDGEYKVLDGNHRLIALYNDGWRLVECLVKDSLTAAKIEEGLTEDLNSMLPYYKNLQNDDRDYILSFLSKDPTWNEKKESGQYSKWILDKLNRNIIDKSVLGHLGDLLSRFEDNKKQLKDKDINKFKTPEDLENYLNDDSNYTDLSHRQEVRLRLKDRHNVDLVKDADLIYADNDWEVWIPKTYAASCKLGQGTRWCTASTETSNYYDRYTNNGNLYININKHNPKEKYQFHFESESFMDKDDRKIGIEGFFVANPVLYKKVYKDMYLFDIDSVIKLIYDLKKNNYTYYYTGFEISGHVRNKIKKVIIADNITSIGNNAFEDCSSLISIVIPNSVTSIGYRTFWGCSSLTSIEIPDSVTSIGESAFYNCSSLTGVIIPNSVTTIGNSAFRQCSGLTSITIPNSVTSIGTWAFYNCSSLTSIEIPTSVTSIDMGIFDGCSSLTSIVIPNSVTSIGDWVFYNCSSLTSIKIPNSVISIGEHAFSYCKLLTSIVIPDSVTSISKEAFSYCKLLTSITIPKSVTKIGGAAFERCNSLTIYCEAQSQPSRWSKKWNPDNRPVVWGYKKGSSNTLDKNVSESIRHHFNSSKRSNEAYHFGNLEYGRKADKRGIMAGRGTGHFGTGFYTIGSVTDDTDYYGRELWELDLTKYNLFKPRSNNAGYTLHDTLKKLNSLFYQYKYNGYTPNLFKFKPYDLRIKLDDFEYEYGNEGIIKFIDSYFPAYREDIDREINMGRWGAAELVAYDSIEDFEDFIDDLDYVVNLLELIFPKEIGKVKSLVWSLIKDNELDDQDNIDSISTLFIKKMGYEGVDVTHLNKAEDGLSGLDNFSYGSVVYDLKPGTYRKIRDKKEK